VEICVDRNDELIGFVCIIKDLRISTRAGVMCTFQQALILVGSEFKRCSEFVPHNDKLCLRGSSGQVHVQ